MNFWVHTSATLGFYEKHEPCHLDFDRSKIHLDSLPANLSNSDDHSLHGDMQPYCVRGDVGSK